MKFWEFGAVNWVSQLSIRRKDSRWVLPARLRTELRWLNSPLWSVLAWLLLVLFWFAAAMEDTSPLLPWWSRIWFDVQRWSSRRRCSGNDGGDAASSKVRRSADLKGSCFRCCFATATVSAWWFWFVASMVER